MKLIVLALCLFISISAVGQSADKGTWTIDGGVGFGIYEQKTNYNISDSVQLAAANLIKLNGSYFIQDNLSVGISLRGHSYLTDPKDSVAYVYRFSGASLLFNTRYHFINKEKFNLYGGISFGATSTSVHVAHPIHDDYAYAELNGFAYGLEFGFRKYFNSWFGIFLDLSFNKYSMVFRYIEVNGDEIDYIRDKKVDQSRVSHTGLQGHLGLSFSF